MFSLATKGDVPKISQPCLNRGIGYDSTEQSGVETRRLNRGEYDVELSAVNEPDDILVKMHRLKLGPTGKAEGFVYHPNPSNIS